MVKRAAAFMLPSVRLHFNHIFSNDDGLQWLEKKNVFISRGMIRNIEMYTTQSAHSDIGWCHSNKQNTDEVGVLIGSLQWRQKQLLKK